MIKKGYNMDFSIILNKLHLTTINIIVLFTTIFTIPASLFIFLTRGIFYKNKDKEFSINQPKGEKIG